MMESMPEKSHLDTLLSQGAHLEQKVDPAEKLIAEHGIEEALDNLENAVLTDPDDKEALRMLKLIQNRATDLLAQAAHKQEQVH